MSIFLSLLRTTYLFYSLSIIKAQWIYVAFLLVAVLLIFIFHLIISIFCLFVRVHSTPFVPPTSIFGVFYQRMNLQFSWQDFQHGYSWLLFVFHQVFSHKSYILFDSPQLLHNFWLTKLLPSPKCMFCKCRGSIIIMVLSI